MGGNTFHKEALNELLLESDAKIGFNVMDGDGTLFATLSGNKPEVLHKFSADLHIQTRQNYLGKTAELATHNYINPSTCQPNVDGLILAGSGHFKTKLSRSDKFDPRLAVKILNVVDLSYGGENGFKQALELSSEILANVKFFQERCLIRKFLEEVSRDTGKYVFGVDHTLNILESKSDAIKTLIVWENLDISRYVMKNDSTGEIYVKYLSREQEGNMENFKVGNINLVVEENMSLLEWLTNEHMRFGCALEFVTHKSVEGAQFCIGVGGIGGILQYELDLSAFDSEDGELYEDGLRPSLNQPGRSFKVIEEVASS